MSSLVQFIKQLPGIAVGELIMFFARALTGVRPVWQSALPQSALRVYFANHGSHGDFVLIWATLPGRIRRNVRPVAGKDYWSASMLKRFISLQVFNALLIDRQAQTGAPSPVDEMTAALRGGEGLILFPEGTRNSTDAPLLPFKSGLFHLSRACPEVELIPVWIDNIRRVIPKGQWLPVPMGCSVTYGAPFVRDPNEDKDTFLRRAEAAVLALRPKESLAP